MKRFILVVSAVFFTAVVSANDTVEDYLSKSSSIDRLKMEVSELELKLRKAELQAEMKNVGKKNAPAELSPQPFQYGDYVGPKEKDDPSYEELAEERKNRVLDNASISSIYRSRATGKLHAEIFIGSGGKTEVYPGAQVGNWVIEEVELSKVIARHISTDETRSVQYGMRPSY